MLFVAHREEILKQSRDTFRAILKGGNFGEMLVGAYTPEGIEKREAFKIVGVKEHYLLNIEENFEQVPLFWQRTAQSGMIPEICSLMNKEPYAVLGVSTCMNGKDFDYYIAVATDKETPNGKCIETFRLSYSDLCSIVKKGDIMVRTGHIFYNRYNSDVVELERYLIITVLRYIHRNPVKANMVKKAEDYIRFSKKNSSAKLDTTIFLLGGE